jgi:hypothetical protein
VFPAFGTTVAVPSQKSSVVDGYIFIAIESAGSFLLKRLLFWVLVIDWLTDWLIDWLTIFEQICTCIYTQGEEKSGLKLAAFTTAQAEEKVK